MVDFEFPGHRYWVSIPRISLWNPLPLTVASVAVAFMPMLKPELVPIHDARSLKVTKNYAGPQNPKEPLDFTFSRWTSPSEKQIKALIAALAVFCNPRQIHILCLRLIIELHANDEREYTSLTLYREELEDLPCSIIIAKSRCLGAFRFKARKD